MLVLYWIRTGVCWCYTGSELMCSGVILDQNWYAGVIPESAGRSFYNADSV